MILLNFSHPLTDAQVQQVTERVGQAPAQVRNVRVQFDLEADFATQVVDLIQGLDISAEEWQGGAWLVVLPSLNFIAAVLLAELHGRLGHFPAIVRLRPRAGAVVTEYEVAEILNLEQVRQQSRARR
jgi:hypothetical protein